MALQLRRGTNADRVAVAGVLAAGEMYYCTDTKILWVGDGSTAGGTEVGSSTPYTDLYNVKLWGAIGDGVTDDTAAIQDAIDAAAAAGGEVVSIPAGTYLATDINVTTTYLSVEMAEGASIESASTTLPVFHLDGATGFAMRGGRLVGPGKAAAGAVGNGDCTGVLIVDSPLTTLYGVEVSGFYHGVRPNSGSTSCTFEKLNIHDCAHTGLWPHDGDNVTNCRFTDMGTTSFHHGLYLDTAISTGVRISSNYYSGITGYAVHAYCPAGNLYNITCANEVIDSCGTGYIFAADDVRGIAVTGAVISNSQYIDANTGDGVKLLATGVGSTFEDIYINAVVRNCGKFGLHCDTAVLRSSRFDMVISGAGDYGVKMSGDQCSGSFVCHRGASVGFYMNGATDNSFNISAVGNGNTGVYVTGTSTDNFINIYSADNTGNGLYFGASAASNRAVGVCQGNSSAQVNNAGTGNNVLAVSGASVGLFVNAGTPEAAVTAGIGSLCTDTTNGKLYVKASGTGNTGWVVAGTQT